MHSDVRARRITGRGLTDKTVALGMLERGGVVRTKVVRNRRKRTAQREGRSTVAAGPALYSDDLASYYDLQRDYAHQTVDHAIQYVDGLVHTNGLEDFWRLLKRALNGTYVSAEPFHLFRYRDEQTYRYNERKGTDEDRFFRAIRKVVGKRLTYDQLRRQTRRDPDPTGLTVPALPGAENSPRRIAAAVSGGTPNILRMAASNLSCSVTRLAPATSPSARPMEHSLDGFLCRS